MINKIISLLTAVFILLNISAVCVGASPVTNVDERIFEVVSYGIVCADSDGNVNIDKPVSRGEFAVMMVNMLRIDADISKMVIM